MNAKKAVVMVVVTTLFFTILGGAIGYGLGKYLPDYYRSIYRGGGESEFNPLAFGVGQGLTQGVTAGAAVGVVLLIVMVWHDVRTCERKRDS